MLPARFKCGHLILYKNGNLKEAIAGGSPDTRYCNNTGFSMTFDEIHDRLREIYLNDDTNRDSRLYDYNKKEFDMTRYTDFKDYFYKNGFTNGKKLLYLCTLADDRIRFDSPVIQNTTSSIVSIPRSIVNIKHEDGLPTYNRIKNVEIFTFSSYSFERSLNELFEYIQGLFQQYRHEKTLFELYEHISTLRFLSLPMLDRIKQENYSINQLEKSQYDNDLEKIKRLFQTIKELIELNKTNISNIDQHSIIINGFNQFYDHFITLYDRWIDERKTSMVSSSSSSSRKRSSSPSTSRKRGSLPSSSRKRSSSPSSSRKRGSLPSRQTTTTTENQDNDDRYSLFKHLLKKLYSLYDVVSERKYKSFTKVVEDSIDRIKSYRLKMKLNDYQSLSNAKDLMSSIQYDILQETYHEKFYAKSSTAPKAFHEVKESIKATLNSIENYQSKTNNYKRLRPSTIEEQSVIRDLNQPKKPRIDGNNDQSSESSHSTIPEEYLRQETRNSYKQRIKY